MSEEDKIIERVGNYTTLQAAPEDCIKCHNAKWGTILIDGLCLDCFMHEYNDRPSRYLKS